MRHPVNSFNKHMYVSVSSLDCEPLMCIVGHLSLGPVMPIRIHSTI